MKIRILPRDNEEQEAALRIIMLNGPMRFTGTTNEMGVPDWILPLLDEQGIPYEILSRQHWMMVT